MGRQARGASERFGFAHARVALDRIEGQVQAAGALQQADAPTEQVVDLLPALAGGGNAFTVRQRGSGLGPAGTMSCDFFSDGLAEVVPQVPAVGDLDGVRERVADRFGVGA
ncbi:hypothetical protein GCM10018955_72230 [Planomonospora venezuelensis]